MLQIFQMNENDNANSRITKRFDGEYKQGAALLRPYKRSSSQLSASKPLTPCIEQPEALVGEALKSDVAAIAGNRP